MEQRNQIQFKYKFCPLVIETEMIFVLNLASTNETMKNLNNREHQFVIQNGSKYPSAPL